MQGGEPGREPATEDPETMVGSLIGSNPFCAPVASLPVPSYFSIFDGDFLPLTSIQNGQQMAAIPPNKAMQCPVVSRKHFKENGNKNGWGLFESQAL